MNERLDYQAPSVSASSGSRPATSANLTVRRIEIPQAIKKAVNDRIDAERSGGKK